VAAAIVESNAVHAAIRDQLTSNEMSCTSSGCHDTVHNVKDQSQVKFWTPGQQQWRKSKSNERCGFPEYFWSSASPLKSSLLWEKPLAFLLFVGIWGALTFVGIVLYLYSLLPAVLETPSQPPSKSP
jgi:hypothetical protein